MRKRGGEVHLLPYLLLLIVCGKGQGLKTQFNSWLSLLFSFSMEKMRFIIRVADLPLKIRLTDFRQMQQPKAASFFFLAAEC